MTFDRRRIKDKFHIWWGHVTDHTISRMTFFWLFSKGLNKHSHVWQFVEFWLITDDFKGHFWTEPRYCGQSQVEVINSRYLLPWPQINCTKNLTLKSSHCSIRMWHRTFSEWWVVHFAIFRDSAPRQIHMYLHFFSWRITHVTGHKVKNKPSFRFPFFIIYFLL